jgi:hypothetical protein
MKTKNILPNSLLLFRDYVLQFSEFALGASLSGKEKSELLQIFVLLKDEGNLDKLASKVNLVH